MELNVQKKVVSSDLKWMWFVMVTEDYHNQ